jgi:hypothetical protein
MTGEKTPTKLAPLDVFVPGANAFVSDEAAAKTRIRNCR